VKVRGELVGGVLCLLFGTLWIATASGLTYMGDFAPGSGFLPLWLGVCLVALSAVHVLSCLRTQAAHMPAGHWRKVLAVALGLILCVTVIEPLGFVVAVGAYLLFLLRAVEKEPWATSLGVTVGAIGVLFALFHAWLQVPLPKGPWGF
jgi:putative tricarboxylic transport membrane protein